MAETVYCWPEIGNYESTSATHTWWINKRRLSVPEIWDQFRERSPSATSYDARRTRKGATWRGIRGNESVDTEIPFSRRNTDKFAFLFLIGLPVVRIDNLVTQGMEMVSRAASAEIFGASLADFFSNSNVGLAVFDDKLRYQAINPWLAEVHRYSVDFHIGKTLRAIVGEVASGAEPAIRRVFATGLPVSPVQVEGRLPTKLLAERWIDSFFPIKNQRGEVHQVGAVVLPIPRAGIVEENSTPMGTVLRSWKEIASYVGACTKTVQRWEQSFKFPVRRVQSGKGAVVFAIRAEVDTWLSQDARTAPAGKPSWANFINSPLPTLILHDEGDS